MHQLSRPPSKPPDTKYIVWLLAVLAGCAVADLLIKIYHLAHQ